MFFTLRQTAEQLGIVRHKVLYAVQTGKVPVARLAARYIFTATDTAKLKNYFFGRDKHDGKRQTFEQVAEQIFAQ